MTHEVQFERVSSDSDWELMKDWCNANVGDYNQ